MTARSAVSTVQIPIGVCTVALMVWASTGLAQMATQLKTPDKTLQQRLLDQGYRQAAVVDSIRAYHIQDWTYLDDQHLLLTTSPAHNYLLSLATACVGLAFNPVLGFSVTLGGDLTRFDKLVLHDNKATETQCPIKQIHRLDPVQKN